jgi:hypothetical protein
VRGHEGSGTTEPLLGGSPTETSELAAEIQDAISEGAISFLLTEVPPSPIHLARSARPWTSSDPAPLLRLSTQGEPTPR